MKSLLPIEFCEFPPGRKTSRISEIKLETIEERAGQTARLKWQLKADHLLLAERVVDVIIANRRGGFYSSGESRPAWRSSFAPAYPLIRLSSYDDTLASKGLFPWKVIVETDTPVLDREALLEASNWLGIGVELMPRRQVRSFGECQVGGGLLGVVGGLLVTHQKRFPMTCSHVLSSKCRSVEVRGTPELNSNQPDAALIDDGNPCFNLGDDLVNCTAADESVIERAVRNKIAVEKRHPEVRQNRGVIRSRVIGFDLNGSYCRFPHLEAIPWNSELLRKTRFFDKPFSREGESGSWVFETENDRWLGMVIGGDDDYFATFIAEAGVLVDYFQLVMAANNHHYLLHPKYSIKT